MTLLITCHLRQLLLLMLICLREIAQFQFFLIREWGFRLFFKFQLITVLIQIPQYLINFTFIKINLKY